MFSFIIIACFIYSIIASIFYLFDTIGKIPSILFLVITGIITILTITKNIPVIDLICGIIMLKLLFSNK